jgi:ribose-phosphate pyrophosphokinase
VIDVGNDSPEVDASRGPPSAAMKLHLFSGTANVPLADAVARDLGVRLGDRLLEHFPDGEMHIQIRGDVRGDYVYVVQPTGPPVGEHLLELLLLADACRRAGAERITAVVPYFGYARQDRREQSGEPLSARLVAQLIEAGGVARVVAVDLHTPSIEGCFAIPLEHLSAVDLLAEKIRPAAGQEAVIVSPDLGAVKLAQRYAALLRLPVAIVHKTRVSGTEVSVRGLVGEVRGRKPIVIDDMISTGGTIAAAIGALLDAGAVPDVAVVASHALLVGPAVERLARLPIRRLVATDSVRLATPPQLPLEQVSLAPLLAEAVRRLHGTPP